MCEYCEKGAVNRCPEMNYCGISSLDAVSVIISKKHNGVTNYFEKLYIREKPVFIKRIHYCPMCGKKLEAKQDE